MSDGNSCYTLGISRKGKRCRLPNGSIIGLCSLGLSDVRRVYAANSYQSIRSAI